MCIFDCAGLSQVRFVLGLPTWLDELSTGITAIQVARGQGAVGRQVGIVPYVSVSEPPCWGWRVAHQGPRGTLATVDSLFSAATCILPSCRPYVLCVVLSWLWPRRSRQLRNKQTSSAIPNVLYPSFSSSNKEPVPARGLKIRYRRLPRVINLPMRRDQADQANHAAWRPPANRPPWKRTVSQDKNSDCQI